MKTLLCIASAFVMASFSNPSAHLQSAKPAYTAKSGASLFDLETINDLAFTLATAYTLTVYDETAGTTDYDGAFPTEPADVPNLIEGDTYDISVQNPNPEQAMSIALTSTIYAQGYSYISISGVTLTSGASVSLYDQLLYQN